MTDSSTTQKQARFIGIGIETYDDARYPHLEKVREEVDAVAELLRNAGASTRIAAANTATELRAELKSLLPNRSTVSDPGRLSEARSSPLFVLWAGHGDMPTEGGVRLVVKDTVPEEAADFTPEKIVDLAARTGARQVLVIIDTCYAGAAAIPALASADRWHINQPDESDGGKPWIAVVSSAGAGEQARDGAFGTHLLRILREGPTSEKLRRHWDSHNAWIDGDMLIKALEQEWSPMADHQVLPVARGTSADEFLPNPLYAPRAPARVVEHLVRAARGADVDDESWYFAGRQSAVAQVSAWIASRSAGIRVITGPAGSGKSAILGLIACLSDPRQRADFERYRKLEYSDPGLNSVAAHVYAAALSTADVARELDAQLVLAGVIPHDSMGPRDPAALLDAVQTSESRPVIFIDGLDEAGSAAVAIAEELLKPLGGSALLIVATRDVPPLDDGVGLVERLDPTTSDTIRILEVDNDDDDLMEYVQRRLRGFEGSDMDAVAVAEEFVRRTSTASGEAPEGRFLLARIVTSQLRARPLATLGSSWHRHLSTSVEIALDADLKQLPALLKGGREVPDAARALLTALTWARGAGLPDDIWPIVATAATDSGVMFDREDVYWALEAAGRYIVVDGESGRAAYRLAHKELADHLISKTREARALPAARVAHALSEHYQLVLRNSAGSAEHTYLWRYLWRHCADAGEDGLRILRKLAHDQPDFKQDLALALDYVSADHANHQRAQLSVAPTEEAVRTYRVLAAENAAYLPGLAMSLNNLGNRYGKIGRQSDAIAPIEEATNAFRALAADDPADLPNLAAALNNLGVRYSKIGRQSDAIAPIEEAVRIYRDLAAENPAYVSKLAAALNNLGVRYSEIGRQSDAIAPIEEAVRIYRDLAAENPAYLPKLAAALNNLGVRYRKIGRQSDAIAPTEEAVELRRDLAAENPAYLPDLAMSLNNLGIAYGEVGRQSNAVVPAEEAIRIYRGLAAENPAHLPDLAMSLNNLGNRYRKIGRQSDALARNEEAARIFRNLATENPAHLTGLAGTLNNLGNAYSEIGRQFDAATLTEEALHTYRNLAAENPAHLPHLAMVLNNLGVVYSEIGRQFDAATLTEAAVHTYRDLAAENPAHLPHLAGALNNLGNRYSEIGRQLDAVTLTKEAISVYRPLAAQYPVYFPDLATALNDLGIAFSDIGRQPDAIAPTEEAVSIYRTLAAQNPEYLTDLAMALNNLGVLYNEIGRLRDARRITTEATQLGHELGE